MKETLQVLLPKRRTLFYAFKMQLKEMHRKKYVLKQSQSVVHSLKKQVQVRLGITVTLALGVCGTPAGHWVVPDVWQNPGTDQGISQSRDLDLGQCCDVGFNVSAVLQCEMLAHGAPSWPGPNSAYQTGWRQCAALLCSIVGANPVFWCLLVDVLAERSSLAGVRRAVAQGMQAPGASSAVRSRAVRPSQLPALPQPSVLLLHSWSGQELVLHAGRDLGLAVLP